MIELAFYVMGFSCGYVLAYALATTKCSEKMVGLTPKEGGGNECNCVEKSKGGVTVSCDKCDGNTRREGDQPPMPRCGGTQL